MPRVNETEPLQKHILLLYEGDFHKLGSFFPDIGPTVAIRRIVRECIKKLEAGISPLPKDIKVDND